MVFVTSKDGTQIGYSIAGSGPAIVLVDGAMCSREMGPATPLAEELKDRFTGMVSLGNDRLGEYLETLTREGDM